MYLLTYSLTYLQGDRKVHSYSGSNAKQFLKLVTELVYPST